MTVTVTVTGYESRALRVPGRPPGGSRTSVFGTDAPDHLYLELETGAGVTGVGVDPTELRASGRPSPETLTSRVDDVAGDLVGEPALAALHRRTRHRGGVHDYHGSGSYGSGVETSLTWRSGTPTPRAPASRCRSSWAQWPRRVPSTSAGSRS